MKDDYPLEPYDPEEENAEGKSMTTNEKPSLPDAVDTVSLWLDMWVEDQSEVEEADICDLEERKVIEAAYVVLHAITSKGDIPDVGEGWRLCSHKVAESYWDGEQWRDLGQYQAAADWYRRRNGK